MAYATGTVANPAALQVIIENFCTANGWTLNAGAGSWLSKGQSHVRLNATERTAPTINNYDGTRVYVTTTEPHGLLVGDSITISGASVAAYNNTFTIYSTPSTTRLTFTAGILTTATGPITITGPVYLTTLTISGANSVDGLTELCPYAKSIYIDTVSWPVTYHLFYNGTPDQVSCVLNYDTTKIQTIMFGDIVKVHNSAYVGGNWFFASKYDDLTRDNVLQSVTDIAIRYGYKWANDAGASFGAFIQERANGLGASVCKYGTALHCKIDSEVWGSSNSPTKIFVTDPTFSSYYRSPNSWNNQAQLIPIHIQFSMASSLYGYLGYVEHLRYIRIDNYEIGDIVTIGTDQWKVFPWSVKNSTYRNGISTYNVAEGTGTLGFACRYTP